MLPSFSPRHPGQPQLRAPEAAGPTWAHRTCGRSLWEPQSGLATSPGPQPPSDKPRGVSLSPLWGPEACSPDVSWAGSQGRLSPQPTLSCHSPEAADGPGLGHYCPHPPGTLPGLCRRLSKGLVVTACEEGQRGLLRPRRGARFTDAGSQAASRPWPPRPSSMTFTQEVFSVWTNLCEPKDEGNESSRRAAGQRAGGQPWPRGVREQRGPLSPRCLRLTVLRGIARGSAGLTVTSCRAWLTGAGAATHRGRLPVRAQLLAIKMLCGRLLYPGIVLLNFNYPD